MIDAIKYHLANRSKVDEDLDSEPLEGPPILGSASSTEAGLESPTVGGVGAQPAIGEMHINPSAKVKNSPAKLAGGEVLMQMMEGVISTLYEQ